MVKFLKPNKAVVVLQGRYAGRKSVIITTILTAVAWLPASPSIRARSSERTPRRSRRRNRE
ncbi:hypothetical protein ACS0TY_000062 [Phlomoides rotata]